MILEGYISVAVFKQRINFTFRNLILELSPPLRAPLGAKNQFLSLNDIYVITA